MAEESHVRVLLIEDEPNDAFFVERMLTSSLECSFSVRRVAWLEEAVAATRTETFDVALLDLGLPDTQGLETITQLQKAVPNIPILVFTGHVEDNLALQAMRRGAQDCLMKGSVEPGLLRRSLLYAIERKTLLDQVVDQNERLREMDRLKNEFVSVVTHELRTPVTAINLSLSMLEDGGRDLGSDENKESLRMLRRNTDRLMQLVNDVLDVSRIEAGRMPLALQENDMHELVREAVGLLSPQARERASRIAMDFRNECAMAQCDGEKIRQVLSNLLNNALLHNEKGLEVRVGVRRQGDRVIVWVSDNGKGIPAEEQHRIFEPYYQVRNLGESYSKGTGLGLAIARGLVEAHHKRLSLRSVAGRGCIFSFELDALPARPLCLQRSKVWSLDRLEIGAEAYDASVRVVLRGAVLGVNHEHMQEILQEILAKWSAWLVLDLSECTQLDSRSIGFLIECRALAMERNGEAVLSSLSRPVKNILHRMGLLNLLPYYATFQAALRALDRKAASAKGGSHGTEEHSGRR